MLQDTSRYYPERYDLKDWLPVSLREIRSHGWDRPDIILVTGDAYVDHPSFGIAVIGRLLQKRGYRVAVLPQPNWRDDLRDFTKLGPPRLFFGISAGNMDSMVNHYTANRRLRSNDAYSIGDQAGFRPDRAVSVYAGIIRRLYPDAVIVAGGIEASLRRLVHYDYWENGLKPGILHGSGIDYLIYGNGERAILELAGMLDKNEPAGRIRELNQLAYTVQAGETVPDLPGRKTVELHSFEESRRNREAFAADFRIIEEESNMLESSRIIQKCGDSLTVVNPPFGPAGTAELDESFDLPYTRLPHPRYWKKPLIPAFEMIRFSVNIHRGCFGGCAFCTISAHQGKHISSRSRDSVISEVRQVAGMPGFKGYLSDLGGPSANMYRMEPYDRNICRKCRKPSCIFPGVCKNLNISHKELVDLYRAVRQVPGIRKAFIGSGVRYDLFLNERAASDPSLREYPAELIRHHVSGRLKVAPEHSKPGVLNLMRKPGFEKFLELRRLFNRINEKENLRQEIIPYFISSHPGCTVEDMAELAAETSPLGLRTEQVQDLTPTPMTLASVMFHTGLDPYTMKPVHVAVDPAEKQLQKSFFFTRDPEVRRQVTSYLRKIGRIDLLPAIFGQQGLKDVKKSPHSRRK